MRFIFLIFALTAAAFANADELEWTCVKEMEDALGESAGRLTVHALGVPTRNSLKVRLKAYYRATSGAGASFNDLGKVVTHPDSPVGIYPGDYNELVVWATGEPDALGDLTVGDGDMIRLMTEKPSKKDLAVTQVFVSGLRCKRQP